MTNTELEAWIEQSMRVARQHPGQVYVDRWNRLICQMFSSIQSFLMLLAIISVGPGIYTTLAI